MAKKDKKALGEMISKGNQGKFTAWAKKNMPGKSVCAAASAVMKKQRTSTKLP